jgi:V8-like Glu-specific endopeptidase
MTNERKLLAFFTSFGMTLSPGVQLKLFSLLLSTLALTIACTDKHPSIQELTLDSQPAVVYGEDSVTEVLASSGQQILDWAQQTAIMISKENLVSVSSTMYKAESKPLGERFQLCASEKDAQSISPGDCSGILLGPDLILTAGHCAPTAEECANSYWVFNFFTSKTEIPASDVYQCREIVERKFDTITKSDYALVRLDRANPRSETIELDLTPNSTQVGDPLLVLGYPGGRPLRQASGTVRSTANSVFLVGSTDTYSGNSGSPVFNLRSGKLVGVLVRGERDYIYDFFRACNYTNVCTQTGCRGEDVTRLTEIGFLSRPQP